MSDFKDVFHNIIGGVTIALDSIFSPIQVFGDEVPQELPKRCFIVSLANASSRKAFGRRYELKGVIEIAYYSPILALDLETELNNVYADIASGMEIVQCGDIKVPLPTKARGEEAMPMNIRCPFTLHLYKTQDDPLMGEISTKEAIK
jgi:hypothetical protein